MCDAEEMSAYISRGSRNLFSVEEPPEHPARLVDVSHRRERLCRLSQDYGGHDPMKVLISRVVPCTV